jgi:uncharacterized protein
LRPHLVVPVGTRVVLKNAFASNCPKGAVAEIVSAPTDGSHSYRVRLPTGKEVALSRQDFSIRRHYEVEGLEADLAEYDLSDCVIYRCIVGSRAYGLDHEESDIDRRGAYLPPAEAHWSLFGVPEQLENKDTQECYWEFQKFVLLALKANPNVLECLYTPLVEKVAPIGQEMLEQRAIFLSKLVYQTYNNYVLSQFKKMEQDLRTGGKVRPKHAMHLVRLMLSGITVLREGYVPVRVEAHRDRLLAIRNGEIHWDEVNAWRLALHAEMDRAYADSVLPDRPDYRAANDLVLRARRSVIS